MLDFSLSNHIRRFIVQQITIHFSNCQIIKIEEKLVDVYLSYLFFLFYRVFHGIIRFSIEHLVSTC